MANLLPNGWYRFFWLFLVGLGLIITLFYSLSPGTATPALLWYITWGQSVLLFVILDFVMEQFFNFSLLPTGEYNPNEYPLQRFLGYNGALLIALIAGVFLSIVFGASIYTQGVLYYPISDSVAQLSTTAGHTVTQGIISAVPSTFIENPLLIMLEFVVIKWIFYGIFRLFNVPPLPGKLVSGLIGAFLAALIFPFIFHLVAYQAIEPAYWRAFIIVFLSLIPVALTGFPIPIDMTHFTNNYLAATLQVVGIGLVVVASQGKVFGLFVSFSEKINLKKWLQKLYNNLYILKRLKVFKV